MTESAGYYEERLYPLQDGVLRTLAKAFEQSFGIGPILTGGTALGRRFFGHRYSDDLDLFTNSDPRYAEYVETALDALDKAGYRIDSARLRRDEFFSQVYISLDDMMLKIDFVNDVAVRFGEPVSWEAYPWVDGLRNILSNKITALYRLEAKDVVDLREIAKNYKFSWVDALAEATEKELGIDAITVSDLIGSFPGDLFDAVKWCKRPDRDSFYADLQCMARDILEVRENSLAEIS